MKLQLTIKWLRSFSLLLRLFPSFFLPCNQLKNSSLPRCCCLLLDLCPLFSQCLSRSFTEADEIRRQRKLRRCESESDEEGSSWNEITSVASALLISLPTYSYAFNATSNSGCRLKTLLKPFSGIVSTESIY